MDFTPGQTDPTVTRRKSGDGACPVRGQRSLLWGRTAWECNLDGVLRIGARL